MGSWCWAGTTDATALIRVRTYYVHPKHVEPWMTPEGIYLWASPSLPTYGGPAAMKTPATAMGHQDAPYCNS